MLGEEINGLGKSYFENVVIDKILDALLELSAMVWTYHDRVNVLEKVLEKKGLNIAEEIENYLPGEQEIAARAATRAELVERVFGQFVRRPGPHTSRITGDDA